MALFHVDLPKDSPALRSAFNALLAKLRNTVETTEVRNPNAVIYPRGTIVSYVHVWNGSTDYAAQVRPTTDNVNPAQVPVDQQCDQQFVGVLEYDMPAGTALAPSVGVARHGGGPVFVRMTNGLTIHVGDAVWATTSIAEAGLGTNATVELLPIYIGMVRDLGNYNPAAGAGTTGVNIIVKHEAPTVAPA